MAVGNDTVKTNLVEVGRLQPQHLVDSLTVDLVGGIPDLLRGTIGTTEAGVDELLTVSVQEVEGIQMGTGRNLDELGKAVPDLGCRQST